MRTFHLCLLTTWLAAGEIHLTHDWPKTRGPDDDFSAPCSVPLIDDLNQAKLVWTSEHGQFGLGKLRPNGGDAMLASKPWHARPGGLASPIVYRGLVYQAAFTPVGELTARPNAADPGFYAIQSEDFLVAMDAATGKTVWKRSFPGLSSPSCKEGGWGITPVAHDGKVISQTTLGRLFCCDATTGEILWDNGDLPAWVKAKEEAIANKNWDSRGHSQALTVIDGVLIQSGYAFAGHDLATGKELWRRKECPVKAPATWRHEDREYLVGFIDGPAILDAKTGKTLATYAPGQPLLERTTTNACLAGNLLFAFQKHDRTDLAKEESEQSAYVCGLRLDLAGITQAWKSQILRGFAGHGTPQINFLAYQDRFYVNASFTPQTGGGERTRGISTVNDLKTGVFLGQGSWGLNMVLRYGDRVLTKRETDHDGEFRWFRFGPEGLVESGSAWNTGRLDIAGYMTAVYPAFADGFLFIRFIDDGGHVRCYDLRR
jgi:hypothetical protein